MHLFYIIYRTRKHALRNASLHSKQSRKRY